MEAIIANNYFLCALFISIRKALGIASTDGALFSVSRAVVSEREPETCCSPEPVHVYTYTNYPCDSSFNSLKEMCHILSASQHAQGDTSAHTDLSRLRLQ